MTNKDKTGNARQDRRREKEKVWLEKRGFTSWESLHTKLMSGKYTLKKNRSEKKARTKD